MESIIRFICLHWDLRQDLITKYFCNLLELCLLKPGPLREILPGVTKTDTGPSELLGPRRNLYSLFVY